jgi:16S rRNA (uracil1498-N3)-methyltransferase
MELYFGKSENDRTILLNEEESHHLLRVKRAEVGDVIDVTNGTGIFYRARIDVIHKRQCELSILSSEEAEYRSLKVHLVVAPTKNIDRMEWLVEKATEIGVDEISFIQCRRSERKDVRTDRLEKIALSAMKQSEKAFLPRLHSLTTLPEFMKLDHNDVQKFICTMDSTIHLADHIKPYEWNDPDRSRGRLSSRRGCTCRGEWFY